MQMRSSAEYNPKKSKNSSAVKLKSSYQKDFPTAKKNNISKISIDSKNMVSIDLNTIQAVKSQVELPALAHNLVS